MTSRHAHYVLSTHWDREWYQTFQNFRYQLVQLIDKILDGWKNGQLKGPFQTDGQAIILEDYLEIRPERRKQVEELLKDGKIVAGPWYVMPDEFIVSGESLVRNLMFGRQYVRSLGGKPSNAGFVCDIFGHNSQLPQIFANFGIHGGFIWRGLNNIQERLVRWRGADGTELPSYRFGSVGYCSFAVDVRHASAPDKPFDMEQTWEDLDNFLKTEVKATVVEPLLLFDGGDHMEWDTQTYRVLTERMRRKNDVVNIKHTSLDAYLEEMLPQAAQITTVVEGELREPALYAESVDQQWLIAGVISSRVWIKQWNAACQALLCQWAEPINSAVSMAFGSEYPQGFLNTAWKWLLMNHPHDSICGCSIDAVHEDMRYRFHQCQDIAERLTREATRKLAGNINGDVADHEVRLVVFNPLVKAYQGVAELSLEIPVEWRTYADWAYEDKVAFQIFSPEGKEIPYQFLSVDMHRTRFRVLGTKFPPSYKVHVVQVSLPLSIPSLGYTTLVIRPAEAGQRGRQPEVPALAVSERAMANEFLGVAIEANGTLTVTDKLSGEIYRDLLTFEDCADIGDGWNFGQASNDQTFVSTSSPSSIARVYNGPLQATFRIRTTLSMPAEFDFSARRRTEKMTEVVVDSLVTLRAGAERIEVETSVHNTAGDHRLRVLFPSGAAAETYLSDTPFDVVERQIALRPDNHLYREPELETKPQQTWSAVFSDGRGLGVISTGLLEAAVRDLPNRPLALTLFRATRRTVNTEGEPGGQLFGDMSFRYWIVPLANEPDRAALCLAGQELAAGLRTAQLTNKDTPLYRTAATLPFEAGFLKMDGDVVVTSIRNVGSAQEVRLFNPGVETVNTNLDLSQRPSGTHFPQKAWLVDFESNPVGKVDGFDGKVIKLVVKPKQILTLHLE